jgi:hypothetical protein
MFNSRCLQYCVFAALQPIANHIHRPADYPVDTPVENHRMNLNIAALENLAQTIKLNDVELVIPVVSRVVGVETPRPRPAQRFQKPPHDAVASLKNIEGNAPLQA